MTDAAGEPSLDAMIAADRASSLSASDLAAVVGLLAKAGRDEEAARYAARLLRARPGHRRALRALARFPQTGVDAAAGWRALAAADPADAEPWLQLARIAAREKDPPRLLEACDALLERAADHPEGLARRCAALIALGRSDALAETWTRLAAVEAARAADTLARALDGPDAEAKAVLLGAARAAGALDAAGAASADRLLDELRVQADAAARDGDAVAEVGALWRIARLDPANVEARAALRASADRLRTEVAAADREPSPRLAPAARALARVDPAARVAHVVLGRIATQALAWREAADAFACALAAPGGGPEDDARLWLELAAVSARRGRMEEAIGALAQARATGAAPPARLAESETLLRGLADAGQRAAFDRADAPEAARLLEVMTGLSADPARLSDRAARLNRLILRQMNEAAEARAPDTVDLARLYLARVADDGRARLILGRALLRERRDGEAVAVWEAIAAERPDDPEPPLQLARLGKRLNRPELGAPAARRAVELSPGHPEAGALLALFEAAASS